MATKKTPEAKAPKTTKKDTRSASEKQATKAEAKMPKYEFLEAETQPTGDYIRDFVNKGIHQGLVGTRDLHHIYGGKPGEPGNTMQVFFVGHPVDVGVRHPDNARMVVALTGNFPDAIHEEMKKRTGIDPRTYVRPDGEKAPETTAEPTTGKKAKKKPAEGDKKPADETPKTDTAEPPTPAPEASKPADKPAGKKDEAPTPKGTPKEDTPAAAGEGYTIQELCKEIGIEPTEARKILRAQKVQKPGGRWAWADKKAAAPIKKIIEDNREK